MLILPPGNGINDNAQNVITKQHPLLGGTINKCNVLIQNCLFANGHFGIQFGGSGNVKILNNDFVANTMAGIEVRGTQRDPKSMMLEVAYNTILFNWSRTKAFEDMGYGFRVMTRVDVNLHHNIIGLSSLSGIDRCRIDTPPAMENGRDVKVNNNRFFLNKQADVTLPGVGLFEYVRVDEFEDVERFTEAKQNEELTNVQGLQAALNKSYLEGFLSATYTEQADYNPDSPANNFRRAMGMNQTMTVNSSVTMFANRYPLKDALKLFGAVSSYGAQKIRN